jgi:GTP-binding protein
MSEYIGDQYEEITPDQIPAGDLPTVAIVGRPNVGKSTLMNRIVGRRIAIVEERPGVTRDRKEVVADWLGRFFVVMDTGGWISNNDALDMKVTEQSEQAVEEADIVLFVVDVTAGVTGEDAQVADLVRRRKGPTLLVANKVDHDGLKNQAWELMSLGVGEPRPVSAMHGDGVADVLDEIVALLPEVDEAEMAAMSSAVITDPDAAYLSISIVGRPNVGKSTLFNRLVGEDRAVVHDMPGTTRDSIDTVVETDMGDVRFVDTAGMRRKARIDEDTEYYSMVRALSSIDKSDIALLVIDSTVGITHQDQRLAERIDGAGCPIVVVLNKWELLNAEQRDDVDTAVERKLHFVGNSPILKMSALTGKGVHRLLPVLQDTVSDYHRRIPTREVNRVMRAAQQATPAPAGARVLYATQGAADPPTFTLFANRTLPATYLRYLERSLREAFDLGGTPIKLRVRRRDE